MQKAAPSKEYVPEAQLSHSSNVAAPEVENLPAGQSTSLLPSQYWPGGVETQAAWPGPECPSLHGAQLSRAPVLNVPAVQLDVLVLSNSSPVRSIFLPASAVEQYAAPELLEYLPLAHSVQISPFPYFPAGQS